MVAICRNLDFVTRLDSVLFNHLHLCDLSQPPLLRVKFFHETFNGAIDIKGVS